jgi:lactate dehydrogenase-like 2-hydroxyacid dehydrogenase
MKKLHIRTQDKLTLISALLIGVIAGAYLYVVGFAPEFENKPLSDTTETTTSYRIVANMYGGMRAGNPPTFVVSNTGQYTYIPFQEDVDEVANRIGGTLPADIRTSLEAELVAAALATAAKPVTKDMCAVMVDGIDYTYTITLGSTTYELDTCNTDFTAESDLGVALQAVWAYVEAEAAAEETTTSL